MKVEKIVQGLAVVAGCFFVGWFGVQLGADINLAEAWEEVFWSRFQYMFVFAVLIERSVEVYLNATDQNGDNRFAPAHERQGRDGTRPAGIATIILSLLVALVGVRLLSTLGLPTVGPDGSEINDFTLTLWVGVDVVISAGLMAGGATLFHEVAEVLTGGVGSLGNRFRAADGKDLQAEREVRGSYTVTITRTGNDTGKLEFSSGGVSLHETCYWNPAVKITAGTYTQCSKTRMDSKRDSVTGELRPGIYLPDAIAPDTGNYSIFIHEGKDPSWSDGCIVLDRSKMREMWNEISPKDGRNVTVRVVDE